VKYWEEWEKFNQSYMSFRQNLFVKEYGNQRTFRISSFFHGAYYTENTGNTSLQLSGETGIRNCRQQFPPEKGFDFRTEISVISENGSQNFETVPWTDPFYFLNASGASFADCFHYTTTERGYPVLLCLQLKFYHGTSFTLELIRNEHKKNQDAIQKNAGTSMKNMIPLVITVFITTEQMKEALDIDNVVVVDWKCFDRFFGNIISRIACSASRDFVNVNTTDLQTLKMYGGIGETLATKIVKERSDTAFKNVEDLINRVKGLPTTLHYQF